MNLTLRIMKSCLYMPSGSTRKSDIYSGAMTLYSTSGPCTITSRQLQDGVLERFYKSDMQWKKYTMGCFMRSANVTQLSDD